jgi:hypothetical protein
VCAKFVDNLYVKILLNDMIKRINSGLYTISVQFKILDVAIDVARLVREPTPVQMEKIASDVTHLHSMCSGVNIYSIMTGVMEAVYQMCLGKYQKGFEVVVSVVNAMALHYILLHANRPYLGFVYGALVVLNIEHNTVSNAYSFSQGVVSSDALLRSKIAYKTLSERFASSPLQALYDFKMNVREYELQINAILFEKEKLSIKDQLQQQGAFGQKLFDYIYLPALTERYSLLNDAVIETLTEEKKADSLKLKPLAISYGSQSYNNCIEAKVPLPSEEDAEHYYCYNIERQVIDLVAIVEGNNLEVLESL